MRENSRPRFRGLVSFGASLVLFVFCSANIAQSCSMIYSPSIIVNRLSGAVYRDGKRVESCTIEVKHYPKGWQNEEVIKSASCNADGSFDVGELPRGQFLLSIETGTKAVIPVVVTRLKDTRHERPETFLNANLLPNDGIDCDFSTFTFHSAYVEKPE